jgi:hypothetical protein
MTKKGSRAFASGPLVPVLPIGYEGDSLVVLDAGRRLYAGLSKDRTRWHVLQPLEAGHPLVGDGIRSAGQLGCSCLGGVFGRRCYRLVEAETLEASGNMRELLELTAKHMTNATVSVSDEPNWFERPAEAGEGGEVA